MKPLRIMQVLAGILIVLTTAKAFTGDLVFVLCLNIADYFRVEDGVFYAPAVVFWTWIVGLLLIVTLVELFRTIKEDSCANSN